ncbi:MAG: type II toxin-antitoxin system Phd/YefM family antitoxin [Desulfitobacteriia bacterium]|jgi:prevent-host-death family protein
MDLRKVFECMISVSELGRGQASKVIQAVEEEGNPFIVVKNNKPQAVIISIAEYSELLLAKEKLKSLAESDLNAEGFSNPQEDFSELGFSRPGLNSLSEDEIRIFLQNEEGD